MDITFSTNLPDTKKYYDLFVSTGWNEKYKTTPAELENAVSKSYYAVSA